MTETLQELFDSRGVRMGVDRLAGVIRGVKILGLESRNGRTYLPEALAAAAPLYEGAKVNVNHPKGGPAGPRDYQDRIGVIRAVKAGGDGLFADFHFNPKHALAEQLLWDAERAPENVGFSHNVEARTTRRGDRVVVEAITRVQSVDLVADPATTRGLFEAATVAEAAPAGDGNPSPPTPLRAPTEGWSGARGVAGPAPLTLVDLQRDYPQLVEALVAEQTAEVRRLEAEVARLTLAEALHQKREAARQLLREFHLPEADSADPVEAAVTSKQFVESLLAAADAEAMRRLVEERARLVQSLGGGGEASRAAPGAPAVARSAPGRRRGGLRCPSVCGSNHRNLNRETRRRHTPCVALDFGTRRVPTTFHPFLERAKP